MKSSKSSCSRQLLTELYLFNILELLASAFLQMLRFHLLQYDLQLGLPMCGCHNVFCSFSYVL